MENRKDIKFKMQHFSDDAIKLATVLYNTYISENDAELHIPVLKLCDIFNYECDYISKSMIMKLFEELNEPIMVPHFEYHGRRMQWQILSFSSFDEVWKLDDEFIEIYMNEMFLYLLKHYVDEPFINIV